MFISLIKKSSGVDTLPVATEKVHLPDTILVHLFTSIAESIITSSITVWYSTATAKDKCRLLKINCSAEMVIGCNLPSLQDLDTFRTTRQARKIVANPSHTSHKMFLNLPSGRRLQTIKSNTSCYKNILFLSSMSLTNESKGKH